MLVILSCGWDGSCDCSNVSRAGRMKKHRCTNGLVLLISTVLLVHNVDQWCRGRASTGSTHPLHLLHHTIRLLMKVRVVVCWASSVNQLLEERDLHRTDLIIQIATSLICILLLNVHHLHLLLLRLLCQSLILVRLYVHICCRDVMNYSCSLLFVGRDYGRICRASSNWHRLWWVLLNIYLLVWLLLLLLYCRHKATAFDNLDWWGDHVDALQRAAWMCNQVDFTGNISINVERWRQ